MSSFVALLLGHCGLLFLLPTAAWAHGALPLATTGLVTAPPAQPGAKSAPVLVALSSGALVSRDLGASYSWICEEALAGPTVDELQIAVTGSGRLLVGEPNQGLRISDDFGCNWATSGDFVHPHTFSALALSQNDAASWVVASNATADGHGSVWQTRDGGAHYARLPFSMPGVYLTGIAIEDGALVVTGTNNRIQDSARAFVSRDDGAHWTALPLQGAPQLAAEVRVFGLGHGRLAVAALDGRNNASTLLLGDVRGGAFRLALELGQPVRQVVASPDGSRLLVGCANGVRLSVDGGQHFSEPPLPRANGCAGVLGEDLLACGSKAYGDGFSVASLKLGPSVTWRPHFSFDQTRGPFGCPADSDTYARCMPIWPEAAQRFGASAAPPRDAEAQAAQAKAAGEAAKAVRAKAASGCHAAVGDGSAGKLEGQGQLLAAVLAWLVVRSRGRSCCTRLAPVRVRKDVPRGRPSRSK